jgi:hypothetical protein
VNAVCLIRNEPAYRKRAFVEGLQQAGYRIYYSAQGLQPTKQDVMLCWNRGGAFGDQANLWERHGGTVMVAENGYIGRDKDGVQLYALALHGHNGSGAWPRGGSERFDALGIEVKPWRSVGDHIVVRGQRGIGSRSMASPPRWHEHTATVLEMSTHRRVVVQEHPRKPACDPEVTAQIVESLAGAHAMCIWASAAGVRALVEGVPVFYAAPHWICEDAARRYVNTSMIEHPLMDDNARRAALNRMAWAQWTVDELASGEPFVRLMWETH